MPLPLKPVVLLFGLHAMFYVSDHIKNTIYHITRLVRIEKQVLMFWLMVLYCWIGDYQCLRPTCNNGYLLLDSKDGSMYAGSALLCCTVPKAKELAERVNAWISDYELVPLPYWYQPSNVHQWCELWKIRIPLYPTLGQEKYIFSTLRRVQYGWARVKYGT